jgi:superfamily II DNA/RNA helicase
VHRIGRTARAGRSGSSLLFLNAPEEPFVTYLKAKHVDLNLLEI